VFDGGDDAVEVFADLAGEVVNALSGDRSAERHQALQVLVGEASVGGLVEVAESFFVFPGAPWRVAVTTARTGSG
jgi:hypothetical protein